VAIFRLTLSTFHCNHCPVTLSLASSDMSSPILTVRNTFLELMQKQDTGAEDLDSFFLRWDTMIEKVYEECRHACSDISFWIPTFNVVRAVHAKISELFPVDARILSVGAGHGYFGSMLKCFGGFEVMLTDPFLDGQTSLRKRVGNVIRKDALTAIAEFQPFCLVFIWPSYNEPWPADALAALERVTQETQYILYCGEIDDGCTADTTFHEILDASFTLVDTSTVRNRKTVLDEIHDDMYLYKKN